MEFIFAIYAYTWDSNCKSAVPSVCLAIRLCQSVTLAIYTEYLLQQQMFRLVFADPCLYELLPSFSCHVVDWCGIVKNRQLNTPASGHQ